uniref:WAP domain-containing protein n=2 Tax=Canis lupus familiaris TaxID=9615 RepID=A0A8I3NTF4_CANLF
MNWLFLQLVILYCLVIMPVTGNMREKTRKVTRPHFINPKDALSDCPNLPNYYDCRKQCNSYSGCNTDSICCLSICGNICMKIR